MGNQFLKIKINNIQLRNSTFDNNYIDRYSSNSRYNNNNNNLRRRRIQLQQRRQQQQHVLNGTLRTEWWIRIQCPTDGKNNNYCSDHNMNNNHDDNHNNNYHYPLFLFPTIDINHKINNSNSNDKEQKLEQRKKENNLLQNLLNTFVTYFSNQLTVYSNNGYIQNQGYQGLIVAKYYNLTSTITTNHHHDNIIAMENDNQ